jgi:hypothetical protein
MPEQVPGREAARLKASKPRGNCWFLKGLAACTPENRSVRIHLDVRAAGPENPCSGAATEKECSGIAKSLRDAFRSRPRWSSPSG